MSCGKWHCNSCMDFSHHPPKCKNCSREENMENNLLEKQTKKIFDGISISSSALKKIIKAGLCVFFVVILGFTILFQTKGISWLFDINYNFLRYIPAFVAFLALIGGFIFLKNKNPQNNEKNISTKETVTSAQIDTLLRIDNKLTASRLAGATNVSVEYAKKVLNDMAVDGKLQVSTEDYELAYFKPSILDKK